MKSCSKFLPQSSDIWSWTKMLSRTGTLKRFLLNGRNMLSSITINGCPDSDASKALYSGSLFSGPYIAD